MARVRVHWTHRQTRCAITLTGLAANKRPRHPLKVPGPFADTESMEHTESCIDGVVCVCHIGRQRNAEDLIQSTINERTDREQR